MECPSGGYFLKCALNFCSMTTTDYLEKFKHKYNFIRFLADFGTQTNNGTHGAIESLDNKLQVFLYKTVYCK